MFISQSKEDSDVSETHCMMMTVSLVLGVGGKLKKEEICVYIQLIHVVQQKLTQCCKAIILQWEKIQ